MDLTADRNVFARTELLVITETVPVLVCLGGEDIFVMQVSSALKHETG